MAFVLKKNELKTKFYKMFQGKCEKEIIDAVLESCQYDDEKTYRSLIEMMGEQLDVLPPSPNKKRNARALDCTPPRPPPSNDIFSSWGAVEADCGTSSHPANLLQQLSGQQIYGSPTRNNELMQPSFVGSPGRQALLPSPASYPLLHTNRPPGSPANAFLHHPPGIPHLATPDRFNSNHPTHPRELFAIPPPSNQPPIQRPIPAPRKPRINKYSKYQDINTLWLILMRGLPGSGKSYKARELAGDKGTILSTDDFFMDRGGRYMFDGTALSKAHNWNQERARKAFSQCCSPIIIDNTHTEAWEMKPYVADGTRAGYLIEIHEADTPWAFKPGELAKKNTHNVSRNSIERMLDKYQRNVTLETVVALLSTDTSAAVRHMNKNISSQSLNTAVGNRNSPVVRTPNLGDMYFDEHYKPIEDKMSTLRDSDEVVQQTVHKNDYNFDTNGSMEEPRGQAAIPNQPITTNQNAEEIRDSSGKLLTSKQLKIRHILHERFPTVDKDALDNVLESCAFNLEASTNYIQSSGVKPAESTPLRSTNVSETKKTPKKAAKQQEQRPLGEAIDFELKKIEQAMDFKEPPKVSRVYLDSAQAGASNTQEAGSSSTSTELSGNIASIVDTFRNTLVNFESESETLTKEPSPKKTFQQGYNSFIEFNLSFLYETFPDLNKKYCQQWLKRYNGDLIKTCDYLSRVSSQVDDLPQDEDGDILEDFDMIDLTAEQDDGSDDVTKMDSDVIMTSSRHEVGGMYLSSEGASAPALKSSSADSFMVAIDKTFAVEMQKIFSGGDEDDANNDLQHDDFVFEMDKDIAKQIYNLWTTSVRAKKRKIESLEEDERFAKQLQEEEDKASASSSQENRDGKGKSKKKRTYLDLETKDRAAGTISPSKTAWKITNENQLTPVAGASGGRLTLKQVNAREQLHRMFPGADEETLDQVLEATKFDLKLSEQIVTSSTGASKNTDLENDLNDQAWRKVVSPPRKRLTPSNSPAVIEIDDENDGVYQKMGSDNISYQDLRAEAELHAQQRREALQKSAEAFQAKNGGTAQYYADKAREHEVKSKEAHFRAAEIMLMRRNKNYLKDQKVIDLHGLHVREAINAMTNFLNNAAKIRHKDVEVITGRGNHNKNGICVIRNAVISYLKKNNYKFRLENNGGSVRIWLSWK